MMKILCDDVINLVKKEYGLASENYGAVNNSSHESYAVLLEELEEARDECIQTQLWVDRFWTSVKGNDIAKQTENLREVYIHSLLAACEFIQTSAMALKALETIKHNASKTEQGES